MTGKEEADHSLSPETVISKISKYFKPTTYNHEGNWAFIFNNPWTQESWVKLEPKQHNTTRI